MTERSHPAPLRPHLRILLTNDDGINAPGLVALEKIARALSDDVWIVAPEFEQSGMSRALTIHSPLRVRELDERRFAVTGTPTDCIAMAARHLMKDRIPDLVLSGVNRGSNIADDVTYSGTVAGAMEGTVVGVKSIAMSQAIGFSGSPEIQWATGEKYGPSVVCALLDRPWPKGILWNVNFPDVPPDRVERFEITRQGRRDVNNLFIDARQDARGVPYYWVGFERKLSNPPEGTDLRAIYEGRISATPLHLDLTAVDLVDDAAQALNGTPPWVG